MWLERPRVHTHTPVDLPLLLSTRLTAVWTPTPRNSSQASRNMSCDHAGSTPPTPPVRTVTSQTRCLLYFPAATRPSAWRVAKVLHSHVFQVQSNVTVSYCNPPPVCLSDCLSVVTLNVNQLFVFTLKLVSVTISSEVFAHILSFYLHFYKNLKKQTCTDFTSLRSGRIHKVTASGEI